MKPISNTVLKDILISLKNSIINNIDTKLSIITNGIFSPSEATPTNPSLKFFSNNGTYEEVISSYRTMTTDEINTTVTSILNQ